jgi:NAD-dependent dihydropyrimidine dehydrogenase PreA subunit/flavodoxin
MTMSWQKEVEELEKRRHLARMHGRLNLMGKQINALYFSATGTTQKIVTGIAEKLSANMIGKAEIKNIDFTSPEARKQAVAFGKEDIVVAGVPVYAGRVPNVLLKYLKNMAGNGASAIAVVVYGNRNYDDALIELNDLLETDGFRVVAGGAFIGEHSFSRTLGQNRPDKQDMAAAVDFAGRIYKKITAPGQNPTVAVKGNRPYREYYKPKNKNGHAVDIRKVSPKTTSDCIDCKLCASICPMGSIDAGDVSKVTGICIKCCACIKNCPVGAKYFDDENYLWHKKELEIQFTERREPEFFI